MNKEKIESMKGKMIASIELYENKTELRFNLASGRAVIFEAVGDCCSNSWIEHFDELKEPAEIIDFLEVEMPASFITPVRPQMEDDDWDCEDIKYYFYELKTNKGSHMIEMRNSSNGYYGGWLE